MSDSHPPHLCIGIGQRNELSQNELLDPDLTPLFEALSHRHRRLVLLLVKEGCIETKAGVKEHCECGSSELDLALGHRHLPKLERPGYIEWDRETGEITKGDRFDEVETFLDLVEDPRAERLFDELS